MCVPPPPPPPSPLPSPPAQVSHIVSAIQAGAVGTQACNEAIATIQGIVGDLETTAMFCTAGALNPEEQHGSFAEHRVSILETAKLLVDDTKKLVSRWAALSGSSH